MWTHEDQDRAWCVGWYIDSTGSRSNGFLNVSDVEALERVTQKAVKGSSFHAKAIQHLSLCKLLNISPAPKD